ncbi:MAG: OPT family small oligopeptide transporter [Linnemannia elongata]|nr:MAG: OPT family small oligopeptide transporter [Linnemannia elongata]
MTYQSRMEEYSHAEGAVEAVGGTAPAGARIAPETAVQRRSTDDTFIQDSNSYNEKTLVGNEAGSVYSGSEGVGVDSLYFDSSRTRLASAATAKDVLSEKEKETDDDERERRDVEPQIPSIDSEDNSPIEEVRAIVPVTDDPSMPTNTFRMWFLALFFTLLVSFVNQFFYLRQNPVSITYTVVSLISLPIGKFLARVLPTTKFRIFGSLGGPLVSLNPGPFNIKEHALIGTAVACCSGTAYAVDIVILQKKYYGEDQGFMAGFMLVLTTQVSGFSLAGVLRKFLVRPPSMIWPANLVTVALFRTLHESSEGDEEDAIIDMEHIQGEGEQGHEMKLGSRASSRISGIRKKRKVTRLRFFTYVSLGSFIWYWFPNYIFPTLTAFSILCWINPQNVDLSQLTGSNGLGIGTLSFDWATSTSALSPLNFPILTAGLFREDGTPYDKAMVMTNNVLDPVKYEAYGPLRMDSFFALTYGIGFAGLTATLTHVALYHGKEIRDQWKAAIGMKDHDIHSRMMMKYKEVPQWWYATLFLVSLALSIFCVEKWHYLPWYYLIVSLAIAFIFALPVGIVQAVTNQQPGLNVITEYVIGYLMPGHPIANVTFKAYGYITNVQALQFTQDLKLGHYMKIPPRIMFWVQVISSVIAGIINLATTDWLLKVRPNLCTKAGYPWTCRNTNTFYSASVIWGVIGPGRMFGLGTQYSIIQWGFVIGTFLPLPVWWLCHRYPRVKWLKKVHFPVLLAATSNMPPAQAYFYPNGIFLGFIFMWYIRRYHNGWWKRYNYVTSAAMDTGVALSGLLCYFMLQSWDENFFEWWGASEVIDHCPLAETNFFGQ